MTFIGENLSFLVTKMDCPPVQLTLAPLATPPTPLLTRLMAGAAARPPWRLLPYSTVWSQASWLLSRPAVPQHEQWTLLFSSEFHSIQVKVLSSLKFK
jgi:hypothetical protein